MNKLEQAARQALEALIKANHFHDYEDEITALREALAEQAEQEPVAWAHPNGGYLSDKYIKEFATGMEKANYNIPLYAAPVQPVNHSEEYWLHEINQKYAEGYEQGRASCKHDERMKALAEPVKQDPVEWFHKVGCRANAFGECDMGCQPPVDAKAIRAEALEEAAKWLKESGLIGSNDCAAAIRGLK